MIERRKIVVSYLDKFPNTSTHCITRMIYKDHPEYFNNYEQVRSIVRLYRGASGTMNRITVKFNKYYKHEL